MRIGIDIKTLKNPRPGGIQIYVINMLNALQHIDTSNHYFLYEQYPTTYQVFNPLWTKTVLSSRFPGTLWLQTHLPLKIKQDKLDVFWSPEQVCPLIKPSHVVYITTIHDYTFMHYPGTMRSTTRLILNYTWKRVNTLSDVLVPVSETIANETRELLKKQKSTLPDIITITNGAPDWTIPPSYHPNNRKNHLLFIGHIEPRKNLLTLIEALEVLHSRSLFPHLKIISPATWNSTKFHNKIAESSVKEQIELCGYLTTESLQHELLRCKALVFPSLYEGFGIPVLEALSLDCLVLTSKNTVMECVAGDCACYFDPTSPTSIADCIALIFQPTFSREPYLKHRTEVLSRYTWTLSAQRLLSQFNRFSR